MKKIEELAALDPSYPADLARGVVLYRLARYPAAVEKFRRHLVQGIEYHTFYRERGRWVSAKTHEVCSTLLGQRLQQRWVATR